MENSIMGYIGFIGGTWTGFTCRAISSKDEDVKISPKDGVYDRAQDFVILGTEFQKGTFFVTLFLDLVASYDLLCPPLSLGASTLNLKSSTLSPQPETPKKSLPTFEDCCSAEGSAEFVQTKKARAKQQPRPANPSPNPRSVRR